MAQSKAILNKLFDMAILNHSGPARLPAVTRPLLDFVQLFLNTVGDCRELLQINCFLPQVLKLLHMQQTIDSW